MTARRILVFFLIAFVADAALEALLSPAAVRTLSAWNERTERGVASLRPWTVAGTFYGRLTSSDYAVSGRWWPAPLNVTPLRDLYRIDRDRWIADAPALGAILGEPSLFAAWDADLDRLAAWRPEPGSSADLAAAVETARTGAAGYRRWAEAQPERDGVLPPTGQSAGPLRLLLGLPDALVHTLGVAFAHGWPTGALAVLGLLVAGIALADGRVHPLAAIALWPLLASLFCLAVWLAMWAATAVLGRFLDLAALVAMFAAAFPAAAIAAKAAGHAIAEERRVRRARGSTA